MNISIIDHVGNKAGMDYYDISLSKGLIKLGCNVTVFSNFIGPNYDLISYRHVFENNKKTKRISKLILFLYGMIKASFFARRNRSNLVILHLFYANVITFILTALPRLFGLKTVVIAHDISSFVDNDNSAVQYLIYNKCATYIVVHNHFSYKMFIKNIKINDKNKIHIIKHGGYFDQVRNKLSKAESRKILHLEEDKKYMLFLVRLKRSKA